MNILEMLLAIVLWIGGVLLAFKFIEWTWGPLLEDMAESKRRYNEYIADLTAQKVLKAMKESEADEADGDA